MTIYRGKGIHSRDFWTKLNEILLAEGYEDQSNPNANYKTYFTKGVNGKNPFYITLQNTFNGAFTIGVYEGWNKETITVSTGTEAPCINWNNGNSGDGIKIEYIVNITKDRIIIVVIGPQGLTSSCTSLTYAGLIKRYDENDNGGGAATLAYTTRQTTVSSTTSVTLLRDKSMRPLNTYVAHYGVGSNPTGWGSKILTCPLYILGSGTAAANGNSEEGLRGEYDDLLFVHNGAPYQTGDTVTHEGSQYVALKPISNRGYVGLSPSATYLLKI